MMIGGIKWKNWSVYVGRASGDVSKATWKASELSAFCQTEESAAGGKKREEKKKSGARKPIDVFDFVWC